jgi:hypothetical protein
VSFPVLGASCSSFSAAIVLGSRRTRHATPLKRLLDGTAVPAGANAAARLEADVCERCADGVTGRRCRDAKICLARGHGQHNAPLRCVRACEQCAACHYRVRRPSDWLLHCVSFCTSA